MRLFLLPVFLLLSTQLLGQSQTIAPKTIANSEINLDVNIVYLTTGDKFYKVVNTSDQYEKWNKQSEYDSSFRYRVSFIISEIYFSLLIERIQLPWDEGEERKAIEHHFYSGFDMAENILPYGRLTNLHFKEWKDYRTFELLESDHLLEIQIQNDGQLQITKK